jgi:hypothetical protein
MRSEKSVFDMLAGTHKEDAQHLCVSTWTGIVNGRHQTHHIATQCDNSGTVTGVTPHSHVMMAKMQRVSVPQLLRHDRERGSVAHHDVNVAGKRTSTGVSEHHRGRAEWFGHDANMPGCNTPEPLDTNIDTWSTSTLTRDRDLHYLGDIGPRARRDTIDRFVANPVTRTPLYPAIRGIPIDTDLPRELRFRLKTAQPRQRGKPPLLFTACGYYKISVRDGH